MPAHAVPDPETVMVEPFNAHLAFLAVLCPVVACDLADSALELLWFGRSQQTVLALLSLTLPDLLGEFN